jgi:hypothetical protein
MAAERLVTRLRKGIPRGLKPGSLGGVMRLEVEASGYLEADATALEGEVSKFSLTEP